MHATDPACNKSSVHDAFADTAHGEAAHPAGAFVYRRPRASA
jgi:hypothetical protein